MLKGKARKIEKDRNKRDRKMVTFVNAIKLLKLRIMKVFLSTFTFYILNLGCETFDNIEPIYVLMF